MGNYVLNTTIRDLPHKKLFLKYETAVRDLYKFEITLRKVNKLIN